MFLDRQERRADSVCAGLRQSESELLALASEELMWNLDEDAGAITGFRIAPARATMRQIQKDLDSFRDDVVALFAIDAGYKPDAAGVVLMRGIVESLRSRQTIRRVERRHRGLHQENRRL